MEGIHILLEQGRTMPSMPAIIDWGDNKLLLNWQEQLTPPPGNISLNVGTHFFRFGALLDSFGIKEIRKEKTVFRILIWNFKNHSCCTVH